MKEKIKKFIQGAILFVLGALVTFGAVIFSNFAYEKQILLIELTLVLLFILSLIYLGYSKYKEPEFIKNIKRKIRIKKAIKNLKKGNEFAHITLKDITYVIENKDKLKDIKDFDILLKYISDFNKKLGETAKKGMEKFYGDLIK